MPRVDLHAVEPGALEQLGSVGEGRGDDVDLLARERGGGVVVRDEPVEVVLGERRGRVGGHVCLVELARRVAAEQLPEGVGVVLVDDRGERLEPLEGEVGLDGGEAALARLVELHDAAAERHEPEAAGRERLVEREPARGDGRVALVVLRDGPVRPHVDHAVLHLELADVARLQDLLEPPSRHDSPPLLAGRVPAHSLVECPGPLGQARGRAPCAPSHDLMVEECPRPGKLPFAPGDARME